MSFFELCVAGIPFKITCPFELSEFDPFYSDFVSDSPVVPAKAGIHCCRPEIAGLRANRNDRSEGGENETHPIPVEVHDRLPDWWDAGRLAKIFATERAWSLYRHGSLRVLTIDPPGFEESPLSVAAFGLCMESASVYLNSSISAKIWGSSKLPNPFSYPLDRLLMVYALAARSGAMFHAAGIAINGNGCMFAGLSGAGKSTLSGRFASQEEHAVLSDERIIVRKAGEQLMVFGTPWPGDAQIAVNKGFPLSAIFFIGHGSINEARPIMRDDAARRLMSLMSVPWYDPEMMTGVLSFAGELITSIPAYELSFTPDESIVEFLEEFTAGKQFRASSFPDLIPRSSRGTESIFKNVDCPVKPDNDRRERTIK